MSVIFFRSCLLNELNKILQFILSQKEIFLETLNIAFINIQYDSVVALTVSQMAFSSHRINNPLAVCHFSSGHIHYFKMKLMWN